MRTGTELWVMEHEELVEEPEEKAGEEDEAAMICYRC